MRNLSAGSVHRFPALRASVFLCGDQGAECSQNQANNGRDCVVLGCQPGGTDKTGNKKYEFDGAEPCPRSPDATVFIVGSAAMLAMSCTASQVNHHLQAFMALMTCGESVQAEPEQQKG